MSYIQIELGGQMRGLKFNNFGLDIMLQNVVKDSNASTVYGMIYGGLRGNSYAKQVEPEYTFEQVIDWIDAISKDKQNEMLMPIVDCLNSTQAYIDLLPKVKADPLEKKSRKKRSLLKT